MIDLATIIEKYKAACATTSDINELLPLIRTYAEKCDHITEMGVREPTSTYAFLASNPKKLISYDIERSPKVADVEALADGVFEFHLGDTLKIEIAETDFLFIDTYHTGTQLDRELKRHANKARKYIGFHDTESFWDIGEPPYEGMPADVACGRGLKYAILPLLEKGDWKIAFMTDKNNGLLVLERTIPGDKKQVYIHKKYNSYIKTKKMRRWLKEKMDVKI